MKLTRTIALLLISASLLTACKKKKDPEPDPTPTPTTPAMNGSMTANLNGNSWTSIRNSAEMIIDDSQEISAIAINGETSADIFVFGIDFPTVNIAVGPHDEGLSKDDAVMIYTKKTANGGTLIEHFTDQGTLNITALDNVNNKISGTFTLKGHKVGSSASADSIKITNGVFTDISFTVRHQ